MLPADQCYETLIQYSEQINMMNLSMRLDDLCSIIGRIYPHLQLKSILLNCEILIKHKEYQLYRKFMVQNLKLLIDWKINMGSDDSNRQIVPHDRSKSCDKIDTMWNNKGNRIKQKSSLLSSLLCILPEEELYETISHYLFLVQNMRSFIVPKYLYSVKKDPYLNLLFKLFWCRKLINEGHADSNIVYRCLNNFYRENCQENEAELTVYIISIADSLSDTSFMKEVLQCYLRKKIVTVTSMATTEHGNERCEYNKEVKYAQNMSEHNLIYTQCASILSGKKMKNVDIHQYSRKFNMKGPEDENKVEMQSEQAKLLILFILLLLLTALGHKSAKLKKYLALKYEYDMASLYLLWCSGDIEVHPGPAWSRKQLEHNSERERKWLQDINSILLKLYLGIPTQSKPKNLWQKDNQPEQWPLDKPFYDTKNASKDAKGNKITDDQILTCLLECLKKEKVDIPHIYQSEISAWTNKNIQLLHKLQVYRIEMENVKSASLNLILSNLEDNAKNLQNIKFSLENSTLDKIQIEGLLNNDRRQKKQAEMVAEITRDLANTLCRLAKGTDPMEKGDGTWNRPPPVDWPDDVPFFNPKNRGKNKDKPKCPDTVLVCTFLKLPYLRIPENTLQIVNAYQTMYNCTDTDRQKKNKEKLCRLYSKQSNSEKLDCSLQNLHKEGLFSREVHGILNQWWKTQSVDEHAEHVLKNALVRSDERPHITIDITKKNEQDTNLRYISYTIHIKDAYLHIKCTTDHPNQSNLQQTITEPLVQANSSENIEDSVLPPDVIDLVLEHDVVDQTECPNDNSVTDNISMPFDLQRQGAPLPIRHQHLTPHNDLDILTNHNTLASDLNSSRRTTEYDTTSLQACDSVHNSYSRNCENLDGNMSTSKVKRKQIEDKEEPVKKLLKIKVNQCEHYDRIAENSSSADSKRNELSLEQIPNNTSTLKEICSDKFLDSWSLYLHENIDEMKNNGKQNDQIEDDKELESFSDLDNFISGKPSQMETDLL
ncbi:uncharacterized protein LOC134690694 [Mytilus trossulus]|uniref:uncharacterized protein LOC134690694 n=1 Tax=Mytilus trossulus TaxID=6551 RepID=UPI003003B389